MFCAPAQYFGRQQDDVLYMMAARGLAALDYRMDLIVGRPPLHMITPGLPALYLPVALARPDDALAYSAMASLMQALAPWLVYAWARRRLDEAASVLVSLLTVAHPVMLSQAGALMSETPYMLATIGLLWAAESGRYAGGWLLLLTQLRPAGLSLLPAALARHAAARRWKAAAATALPAALGALAWVAWSRRASGSVQEAAELRQSAASLDVLGTGRFYAETLGAAFLPSGLSEGPAAAIMGAALASAAAAGAWKALRARRDDAAAWALAGWAAMHAVWAWRYERYLIPALPLLWFFVAAALGRRAPPALGALLACCLAFSAPAWLAGSSWRRPELTRAYAWIASNVPPWEAVASVMYARDALMTSRPALPLPREDDAAALAAALRRARVRWVLRQDGLDVGLPAGRAADELTRLPRAAAQLEDGRFFVKAHAVAEENAVVYRLR